VLNQFATLGLSNTAARAGAKLGICLDGALSRILHQLVGAVLV